MGIGSIVTIASALPNVLIGSATTRTSVPNEPASGPTGSFGVPEGRDDINENYIVTIQSTYLNRSIRAHLQGPFQFKTTSQWQRPTQAGSQGLLGQAAQIIAQAGTGKTIGNAFMTRRIWKGTSPCMFSLNIKFEAVEDSNSEVVLPCETLHQIVVPGSDYDKNAKGDAKSLWNSISLYPPGPNPTVLGFLSTVGKGDDSNFLRQHNKSLEGKEDNISITIGRFLHFEPVIVSEASITYLRKYDVGGKPIAAEANIAFESFEMYTKEALHSRVYNGVPATSYQAFKGRQHERLIEREDNR